MKKQEGTNEYSNADFIKSSESSGNKQNNLTRQELQAWGTKIIAEARPKNYKKSRAAKEKRMSRKEYIEKMAMKETWWKHYGRNK